MTPRLGRAAATLALALAWTVCQGAAPARAEIYGVVVGIDAYRSLPRLNGAANDARDLAAALTRLGAEVDLILDGEATRERVIGAIRRDVARAGPGDMFVLTYAGHGIQEDEAIPGDEADGKDESIVFASFEWSGANAGERIRDNEVGALLRALDPAARALVLIDSCHSGTMTRAADPRGEEIVTRFGGIGRLGKDPLPPLSPAEKGLDLNGGSNVVFVAAGREDERIPEVRIDGRMRGAVSWTIARALEGQAAYARPDMPLGDFRAYVTAEARALSAARQTPSVSTPSGLDPGGPLMPATLLGRREPPRPAETAPAPTPKVFAMAPPPGDAADLDGLGRFVDARDAADLVWDVANGEVIDAAGADLVGDAWDMAMLGDVLAKWRSAQALGRWAGRKPAGMRLAPGDGRHRRGAIVEVFVERPSSAPAHLTLVNLASTGQVQFVYPSPQARRAGVDLTAAGAGEISLGAFRISDPVGADHVIAILSPDRPDAFQAWLETERPNALAFVERLKAEAAEHDWRVGITPIFTTR